MPTRRRPSRPDKLTLKTYQVGFGDCFLLTFHYGGDAEHILIDFGSTRYPDDAPGGYLKKVAKQIKADCGGRLLAVIATHRHRDHIRGFAGNPSNSGPGDLIGQCNPAVVIQPWTEDPDAPTNASGPTMGSPDDVQSFVQSLDGMNTFAQRMMPELKHLPVQGGAAARSQLAFLGENNIANKKAVKKLLKMGKGDRGRFVFHGSASGLEGKLSGVKVHVLGPPTLRQSDEIRRQAQRNDAEYWHFQERFWQLQAKTVRGAGTRGSPLFPDAPLADDPIGTRWFRSRLKAARVDTLLKIVRILDDAMNNTSVILLFEIGDTAILFPGDAQIENWMFALGKPKYQKLLKKVRLYKVGHHGSLNATPKSLWALFEKRGVEGTPERLRTVLSTLHDVHGSTERNTEVPRRTLVAALKKDSDLLSTEDIPVSEMGRTVELDLA